MYTIALNEAAHAERWANSATDADYRIVADTGSTDDTVELLTGAGVTVHRITVRPWRFDVARNTAMALIPPDVDVCCSMDMDRALEPGWRPKLEAAWTPEMTALFCRVVYRASEHDPTILRGWPAKNFHRRCGYHFKRPVHEALVFTGKKEVAGTCDGIVMSEVQDHAKTTRSQYLPLMELAHKEDPNDAQICFWLGRDYMWANQHELAIELFERYLSLPTSTWAEERSEAMRYLARLQPAKKMFWLDNARREAPHRREIWLDLAEELHGSADWPNLFWACTYGIEKTHRTGSYLDDAHCWGFRLFDLGAIASWHLNAMDQAVAWGKKALELGPNDQRLKNNFDFFVRRRDQNRLGDIKERVRDELFARISKEPVTLLQVGANDGSLLGGLIRKYSWTGILIEPVPFIFDKLRRNYADLPNVVTLNVGVHPTDDHGRTSFYSVKPLQHPPVAWYNGLSSFKKEVILKHADLIPGLQDLVVEIPVITRTLRSILDELKIERVDFLMIDAEGSDGEIVRSFPFEQFHPKLVLYETKHLAPQDHAHTEDLLRQFGYYCLNMKDWEDNVYGISSEIMRGEEARFLQELIIG